MGRSELARFTGKLLAIFQVDYLSIATGRKLGTCFCRESVMHRALNLFLDHFSIRESCHNSTPTMNSCMS